MMIFDDDKSDRSLNSGWYAVITDAHLNFRDASDSFDRNLPVPFGDGAVYSRYVKKILESLNGLAETGLVDKTVVLGDFFDSMQTEGLNEIISYDRAFKKGELWTAEKKNPNFSEAFELYKEIVSSLKKSISKEDLVYVRGNHDDVKKLEFEGLPYVESFETSDFNFGHGHPKDLALKDLGLSPDGPLGRFYMSPSPPIEKGGIVRSAVINAKNIARIMGVGFCKADNFVKSFTKKLSSYFGNYDWVDDMEHLTSLEKYGKSIDNKYPTEGYEYSKVRYLLDKEEKGAGDKFAVMGHEHNIVFGKNGVALGDLYNYGVSFVKEEGDKTYVLAGVIGPKDVYEQLQKTQKNYRNIIEKYDRPFELGHLFECCDGKVKFLGEVSGNDVESVLEKYGHFTSLGEERGGLSQTVQEVSPVIYSD